LTRSTLVAPSKILWRKRQKEKEEVLRLAGRSMFTSPLEFDIVLRAKNASDNLVSQLTITTPALATHHVAQDNGYG